MISHSLYNTNCSYFLEIKIVNYCGKLPACIFKYLNNSRDTEGGMSNFLLRHNTDVDLPNSTWLYTFARRQNVISPPLHSALHII